MPGHRFYTGRPVSHVDAPHSCRHCEQITITEQHIHESEHYGALIRLPYTISKAKLAAQDGCPLYESYTGLLKLFTTSFMVRDIWRCLKRCFTPWKSIKHDLKAGNLTALRFPEPLNNSWLLDKSIYHISTRLKHFKHILSHLCCRPLHIVLFKKTLQVHCLARTALNPGFLFPVPKVLYMTTSSDDPAASLISERSINPIVWDEESQRLAKQWLTHCHASHFNCRGQVPKTDPLVPKRLLKLHGGDGGSFIQLYETKRGESIQWCALSYCWGGDQHIKATRHNLEELKRGIPSAKLPRTLQDAINVSVSLGISFLWVDALCIMQDDDHDIVQELQKIPSIYSLAYVTISASSARSVQDGFLQDRGYFYGDSKPFCLPYRSANGAVGKLLMSEDKIYTTNRNDWREPVDYRCWTLQEQELSPRLLTFGLRELTFNCMVGSGSTNGVSKRDQQRTRRTSGSSASTTSSSALQLSMHNLPESSQEASDEQMTIESVASEPTSLDLSFEELSPNSSRSSLMVYRPSLFSPPAIGEEYTAMHQLRLETWILWKLIVEQYSRRSLTVREDKLRALSGLARAIVHNYHMDGYVAGSFMEHLPLALCWDHSEYIQMPLLEDVMRLSDIRSIPRISMPDVGPTPLSSYEGAPSWSWLAAEGEVEYADRYLDIYRFESQVEILEVSITPRPPFTTYDAINGGVITLKGRLSPARWYVNDFKLMIGDHEFATLHDSKRKDWPQGKGACLNSWALLLVTERNRPHGPIAGEDGQRMQGGVFYPGSPDGYVAGLVLEACDKGSYKRLATFSEAPLKRVYFFEDINPQIVRLI